jgi:hypothetical protein
MEKNAGEIKDLLATGDYSILKSLGANRMRLEMRPVGWGCRLIVWLIYMGAAGMAGLKLRTARLVKFFFPTVVKENNYRPKNSDAAMVVYFNHQSLFEVLAAIEYCLRYFPNKNCIFPVNLPWYEALCPVVRQLEGLGICITPMITPKTYLRLSKVAAKNDADSKTIIDRLKGLFEDEYWRLMCEFIRRGDVVAVAPSATRTDYIFPSEAAYLGTDAVAMKSMPKTMSAILLMLKRAKMEQVQVDFVPFVATRNKRAGRGLNVWRRHDVYIGAADTLEEMQEKRRERTLDFWCYRRLAGYVPQHVWHP